MVQTRLTNFCIEPETEECTCTLRGCGGINFLSIDCPEHGYDAPLMAVAKTHLHPVQVA